MLAFPGPLNFETLLIKVYLLNIALALDFNTPLHSLFTKTMKSNELMEYYTKSRV